MDCSNIQDSVFTLLMKWESMQCNITWVEASWRYYIKYWWPCFTNNKLDLLSVLFPVWSVLYTSLCLWTLSTQWKVSHCKLRNSFFSISIKLWNSPWRWRKCTCFHGVSWVCAICVGGWMFLIVVYEAVCGVCDGFQLTVCRSSAILVVCNAFIFFVIFLQISLRGW